jgi:hypothetical protein
MKHAEAMLREIVLHVRPPRGCAIVLLEWESKRAEDENWVASVGIMDADRVLRFTGKVAELRKTDPIIDWSEVQIRWGSQRRVALWLSEVEGDLP